MTHMIEEAERQLVLSSDRIKEDVCLRIILISK
jgi:hypothetical protein